MITQPATRPTSCLPRQTGLTLIELMVVVVIAALLLWVALPGYLDMVSKSRRADARNALMSAQLAMMKYRGNNQAYATTVAAAGISSTSPDGHYTVSVNAGATDANAFILEAAPAAGGAQAGDSCGTFAINQDGPDTSGAYASSACWQK